MSFAGYGLRATGYCPSAPQVSFGFAQTIVSATIMFLPSPVARSPLPPLIASVTP